MIDESVVRGVSQCLLESAAVPLLLYHLARSQDFLLEGGGGGGRRGVHVPQEQGPNN